MLVRRASGRIQDSRADAARDDDLRSAVATRELDQYFDSVHLRHDQVNGDVRRVPLVDGMEEFHGGRHESRGQPHRLRDELHHLADVGIVVEDQQPRVRHAALARATCPGRSARPAVVRGYSWRSCIISTTLPCDAEIRYIRL
jgi:hypothetical protein